VNKGNSKFHLERQGEDVSIMLTAEWRTKGPQDDVVLVLEGGTVREALAGSQIVISRFLTEQLKDLDTWRGESQAAGEKGNPEIWGELVISRADTGEVLDADPELLWQGIYLWFRSQGVDYDSPSLHDDLSDLFNDKVKLRRSQLMDD
jgi:hypothetical protein